MLVIGGWRGMLGMIAGACSLGSACLQPTACKHVQCVKLLPVPTTTIVSPGAGD